MRACQFKSRNCLREVNASLNKAKPIALVHDPIKGGASVQWIRKEECPAELIAPIFDAPGRKLIEWHRIKDFQVVSLKLIARQILHGCPAHGALRQGGLFIPGELTQCAWRFRRAVRVYCSRSNPGAAAAGRAIQRGLSDLARQNTSERSGSTSNLGRGDAETGVEEWKLGLSLTSRQPAWAMPSEATPTRGLRTPHGSAGTPTHFLLYLNRLTFTEQEGEALADEVRMARQAGIRILMLHENDKASGGCEFGRFFEVTPKDLISDGLYSALALAFYPKPFRSVSVCLAARALGAVDVRTVASRLTSLSRRRVAHMENDLEEANVAEDGGGRPLGREGRAATRIQSAARGKKVRNIRGRFERWRTARSTNEQGSSSGTAAGGEQTASLKSKADLKANYVAYLMFERFDLNNDGKIDPTELRSMCAQLGKPLRGPEEEQLALARIDADESGAISAGEFYEWCAPPCAYAIVLPMPTYV